MIISIIIMIFIIGSLVLLHEWGHFVVARRNGIKVEEFGIGFPPRLLSKRVGLTIYSINALPLGGFVRMKGEDGTDQSRGSFNAASFMSKTKVLLAGVGMNALTAYILLLALCLIGLPPITQNQFSLGAPTYVQPKQVMVASIGRDSVAARAGLHEGDIILSANGQKLEAEGDLVNFTKAHAAQAVTFQVKPQASSVESTIKVTLNDAEKGKKEGFLGVTPLQVYKLRYGWTAPVVAFGLLVQLIWATLAGFGALLAGLLVHARVSEGVAGPVGIAVLFSNIARLGISYVALFVATISISLAVINTLPIPALDGGRLALITAQKVLGRKLSPQLEARIHMVGFMALITLMVVVTYFDIKSLR